MSPSHLQKPTWLLSPGTRPHQTENRYAQGPLYHIEHTTFVALDGRDTLLHIAFYWFGVQVLHLGADGKGEWRIPHPHYSQYSK